MNRCNATAHSGCANTVRQSVLNVDCGGKKIPCCTGQLNLHQQHAESDAQPTAISLSLPRLTSQLSETHEALEWHVNCPVRCTSGTEPLGPPLGFPGETIKQFTKSINAPANVCTHIHLWKWKSYLLPFPWLPWRDNKVVHKIYKCKSKCRYTRAPTKEEVLFTPPPLHKKRSEMMFDLVTEK